MPLHSILKIVKWLLFPAIAVFIFIKWVIDSVKDAAKRKHEREQERLRKQDKVHFFCHDLTDEHAQTLAIQRTKYITKDAFGREVSTRWDKEVKHFMEKVLEADVYEKFGDDGVVNFYDIREQIEWYVYQAALEAQAPHKGYTPDMSGEEYEQLCAQMLKRLDWSVSPTKTIGDQGVDLIAEKAGRKVAVQCKKSSSAVGNKAVQEVVAGQKFYSAQDAAVVSDADFTRSAKELANVNCVKLLHHLQLDQL